MPRWIPLPEYAHTLVAEAADSILLETKRFDAENRHSYLFRGPVRVITANTLDDIPAVFTQIDDAIASGLYVAGYFAYECGYHFERCGDVNPVPQELPLIWLGVYDSPHIFDHTTGNFNFLPSTPEEDVTSCLQAKPFTNHLALNIPKNEYLANIRKIKEYIAAGETYQVNFTDSISLQTDEQPAAIFSALAKHHSAAYSAMMHVAGHHILSFSPELFFKIDGRRIITRPMKGTMPRGLDTAEDIVASQRLQNDAKNCSEHVMIVDLLRNDLGRICTMGSVKTDDLFSIERYETLLQMTSTVSGMLRADATHYDIFRSLFPSGSVTGAPKIRTMQIIRSLEHEPRGIYTGAIGFFAPDGSAQFNVAIRTLVMKDGNVRMGVGGGIVAESDPEDEHSECLLKAAFLTRTHRDFRLIESMLWDGDFARLPLHLDRLEASALYFDFTCNRAEILLQLQETAKSFGHGSRRRIRLLLHANGKITLESPMLDRDISLRRIKLSAQKTTSTDVFLRHKTTHRALYDTQYAEARAEGFDEVLFTNERDEITEGAITNLFIKMDGRLFTPPLSSGVLPGIYRRHMLETLKNTEERILTLQDLQSADAIFLCNSIRGLQKIQSVAYGNVEAQASETNA